jgi:hypothetical protein
MTKKKVLRWFIWCIADDILNWYSFLNKNRINPLSQFFTQTLSLKARSFNNHIESKNKMVDGK